MKKKILGIILTVTMVFAMIPAFALPTLAASVNGGSVGHDLKVLDAKGKPAEYGKDYSWDDSFMLDIHGEDLVVTGKTAREQIRINDNVKKITFSNLQIVPETVKTENANSIAPVFKEYAISTYNENGIDEPGLNTGNLEITLVGDIVLGKEIETPQKAGENLVEYSLYGGIHGQSLAFKGDGNLYINCAGAAIVAGSTNFERYFETINNAMKPNGEYTILSDLVFDKTFTGNVKIHQYGRPFVHSPAYDKAYDVCDKIMRFADSLENTDSISEQTEDEFKSELFEAMLGDNSKADGWAINYPAIIALGNVKVHGGSLEVISETGRISKIDSAGVRMTVPENLVSVLALDMEVTTPKTVSIESKGGVAALLANEMIIDKSATKVSAVGSLGINLPEKGIMLDLGALVALHGIEISDNLSLLGCTEEDSTMTAAEVRKAIFVYVDKEKMAAEVGEPMIDSLPLREIEIPFYTCFVGDKVASTFVAQSPETPVDPVNPENPTNPKTADTGAMILWALAGLAALAVVAGVLVSKKQRD